MVEGPFEVPNELGALVLRLKGNRRRQRYCSQPCISPKVPFTYFQKLQKYLSLSVIKHNSIYSNLRSTLGTMNFENENNISGSPLSKVSSHFVS